MNESNRGTLVTGILLVVLGIFFAALNLIPGLNASKTWPLILITLAAGFILPAFIWPQSRKGLASLFIPASILLVLGVIFLFNTLTGIWNIWAIAWMLIPASVGLGLLSSARVGKWNKGIRTVGVWILIISLTTFSFFTALFTNPVVKYIGAAILVLTGVFFLIRSLTKKNTTE
ncbi:MAG: hypothetical protein NTZ74_01435 [Chloroflexi bacterium]|nr:hypothetical protein [Chloroflexota bacterium]